MWREEKVAKKKEKHHLYVYLVQIEKKAIKL